MQFARPGFDIGLFSNQRDAQLGFWQQTVGLAFDHLGKLGGGLQQHRHVLGDAVLKMNHARDPLPGQPAGGLAALHVFLHDAGSDAHLVDPDGNRVLRWPTAAGAGASYAMTVCSPEPVRLAAFYRDVLGFMEVALPTAAPAGAWCLAHGAGRIFVTSAGAEWVACPDWRGPGYRYLTLQVMSARDAWAEALAGGATEGEGLRELGDLVRFGFIRDPDGNWFELSERTTFTGRPLT